MGRRARLGLFAVYLSGALLCCSGGAVASTAVSLHAGSDRAAILPFAQAADGRASIADVKAGRAAFMPFPRFHPHGWPVSLWLRFSVNSREHKDRREWLIVIPQQFESAELYRGNDSALRTGMYVPFRDRPTDLYVPAFRVSDRDYGGPPLLLHLVYYPDIPLSVHMMNEHAFFMWNEPFRLVEGLFIGVLVAVALFNLFVFGIIRDKNALWYIAYIVAMIANEVFATGIGEEFLWPGLGTNVRLADYGTNVLAFLMFLYFARSFLRTREEARGWDRALVISFWIFAILQGAQALVPGGDALVSAVLVAQLGSMLMTVLAGIFRLRGGYEPARFFVVGFVPSMIGVAANLYYDTFLPAGNWFWAMNGVEIGTLLQATILSFSIIDRLRILQREQHRTRSELSAVAEHAKKMQSLALFDPLTGLPNRVRFTDELSHAVEQRTLDGRGFAVLFCDLDGFKAVNDHFGHRVGDEVLRIVTRRLSGWLREQDLIARLGGDEFAVLLDSSPDPAEQVAFMLSGLLDEPLTVEGKLIPISISVGHAVFPHDGRSMDELLHAADLRMYEMKQQRKAEAS